MRHAADQVLVSGARNEILKPVAVLRDRTQGRQSISGIQYVDTRTTVYRQLGCAVYNYRAMQLGCS